MFDFYINIILEKTQNIFKIHIWNLYEYMKGNIYWITKIYQNIK